jgi:hypothetical protein
MNGWMAVFADVPADRAQTALRFWEAATATGALPAHGARGEFVPLAARGEDPYLWLQQVDRAADDAGWHLDLFAADPGSAADMAVSLGARCVRAEADLVTLTTPAGQPFCLVNGHEGQRRARPRQWPGGHCSLLDQVCLHLPSPVYEDEARFWSDLTGWERRQATLPEFSRLAQPPKVPVRILLQRLGPADTGSARAHVDFSCSDVAAEQRRHEGLGAITEGIAEHWITLRDPVGLRYCITDRKPAA